MGVDVASGKILWQTPVKTGAKRHVLTPILADNSVTISSSSVGLTKFSVLKDTGGFKVEPAWKNDKVKITLATPVLVNGHLYGLGTGGSKTEFICVDFKTGEQKWKQAGFGDYAAVIAATVMALPLLVRTVRAAIEADERLAPVAGGRLR